MRTLLKNRLAATGFCFLVFFIVIAVAAPLLTPYNPNGSVVAGKFAAPDWIAIINGPSGYSKNTAFSGLYVNQSGTGLQVNTSGQTASSVNLHISTGAQPGTVQLVEKLAYPYSGAPYSFLGLATLQVTSPLSGGNFTLTVYLERVGTAKFPLWFPIQINSTGSYAPSPPIDSTDGPFNTHLGIANVGVINAANYLFAPRVADYNYVMQFSVPAQFVGTIKVTQFSFTLLGNTWGILGTDDGGHDIFTQIVYGARLSLLVGLVATAISIGFGLVIGLMAGYLGKVVDEILMRFTDMLLVIPNLPLLIVLVATIGPSLLYIILFLGFFGWQGFARLVRSQVLSLRERPFIEAAKAAGAGTGYIAVKHVFPNIVSLTYVSLALSVPAAIVGEAALSFLGLGDPTTITWGQMLQRADAAGINTANLAWWWIIPPGIAIAMISLSFILLGYSMDELFNPKLRRRR